MATYLDGIVAFHRGRASRDDRDRSELERAAARAPEPRGFLHAIVARRDRGEQIALIAEVKRRSPSKGELAADLDPAALASAYERGGAACLSVLTDGPHFGGSAKDLESARAAVALPVLRKDFTVCEADVLDARAMGADAVLLIAAVLDDGELSRFSRLAADLDMAAVVEVHDEGELARALGVGAIVVGVNQRDLRTFAVDTERAVRVAESVPTGVVKVAESGVRDATDVSRLAAAGFDAVLVGESLVVAGDPERAARELSGGASCS